MIFNFIVILFTLTPFSADKVEIIKEEGESIIHLIGNVVIKDENVKIECEDARMYETEDYVILDNEVVITDKEGSIKADHAQYRFAEKQGYMTGDVNLVSGKQIITAESLYYDGNRSYVEMHRNVVIEDQENDMFGYGGKGWYHLDDDIGHLVEAPRIELLREDRDPIHIRAQEFELRTKQNMFYGYDSVHAEIDSINVECDTFTYDLADDNGAMVKPHVVEKENILKGETGAFRMKDENIESFSVHDGWSKYLSEEGNRNEVEGDTITVIFEEGEAVKIIVMGDPSGVLMLKKESENVED